MASINNIIHVIHINIIRINRTFSSMFIDLLPSINCFKLKIRSNECSKLKGSFTCFTDTRWKFAYLLQCRSCSKQKHSGFKYEEQSCKREIRRFVNARIENRLFPTQQNSTPLFDFSTPLELEFPTSSHFVQASRKGLHGFEFNLPLRNFGHSDSE